MRNLLNYFFPTSVNGVMAAFQKTVDDLHKVAQHKFKSAHKITEKIDGLLDEVEGLSNKEYDTIEEGKRAVQLANKLESHFGLSN